MRLIVEMVLINKNQNNAVLVITRTKIVRLYHSKFLFHVLMDGKIVKSGGKELCHEEEKKDTTG
jgi:Fe-S cluster assembly ATP-binding protein